MRRIRLLGLALIAVFALGAFASASAFAASPEILPVPTAEKPANFQGEETTKANVVRGTKEKGPETLCKTTTATGSFTTQDKGTATIKFSECKAEGANCLSPGQASGTILRKGEAQLVAILPGGVLALGVLITPHEDSSETADATYKCGVLSVELLGAVIGVIDLDPSKELLKDLEKFKAIIMLLKEGATRGEAEVKECMLLEATCKGQTFELKTNFGKGEELASMVANVLLTFEKELEVHF